MALALATACVFALTASPALAHQFTASKVGKSPPFTIKGAGVGVQEFKFGALKFSCAAATLKGSIAASPAATLTVVTKYKECEGPVGPFMFKVHFTTPVAYQYHANGFVENGTEVREVHIVAGTVEAKEEGTKCVINWPEQTIPVKAEKKPEEEFSAAVFSNEEVAQANLKKFPSGFQQRLVIANEFKGMEYELTEGHCEELEKGIEGKSAKYTGTLRGEIVNGNLGWE